MNRALLLSAVLLTTAGCSANEEGIDAARSEAELARANSIETTFVSTGTHASRHYVQEQQPDGSLAWVIKEFQVKTRLRIIQAADYGIDNTYDEGLDYEAVLEEFIEATGQTFFSDNATYFIRKEPKGYTFFNCSSTRRCFTQYDTTPMELTPTADGGQKLVIDSLSGFDGRQEFVEVR